MISDLVNDAPQLDSTAVTPILTSLPPVGSGPYVTDPQWDLVASLVGVAIQDPDGRGEGIAVTGVDNAFGTWQYSLGAGAGWHSFGQPSDASVRLLTTGAMIRFVPRPGWNGLATIQYRAWDQTVGIEGGVEDASRNGGTAAFSTGVATAAAEVQTPGITPRLVERWSRDYVFRGNDVFSLSSTKPFYSHFLVDERSKFKIDLKGRGTLASVRLLQKQGDLWAPVSFLGKEMTAKAGKKSWRVLMSKAALEGGSYCLEVIGDSPIESRVTMRTDIRVLKPVVRRR
jgi:hypothetical protein